MSETRILRIAIKAGNDGCEDCPWIYDRSEGMFVDTHKCRLFGKELLGIDGARDPFYRWACKRLPECLEAEQ
jgi:hypothetical protein